MWRLVIAFVTAVPIVACSTSGDPESAQKTASTRVAPESEAESSALTSPPYSSDGLAPGVVEGDPRWLTGPKEPTTKRLDGDCSSLAAHGWEAECERVTTELGDAVWIREQQGQQERVSLYVHREGNAWDLAWRATDESGREFDSKVLTADLAGDGNPKVIVTLNGVDLDAADQVPPPVEVAIMEPSGEIVVHLMLHGGRSGPPGVIVRPGEGLEVRDCPVDCVPTAPMRLRLISYTTDGWRIVDERAEPRS
jgi:hypothetical protein